MCCAKLSLVTTVLVSITLWIEKSVVLPGTVPYRILYSLSSRESTVQDSWKKFSTVKSLISLRCKVLYANYCTVHYCRLQNYCTLYSTVLYCTVETIIIFWWLYCSSLLPLTRCMMTHDMFLRSCAHDFLLGLTRDNRKRAHAPVKIFGSRQLSCMEDCSSPSARA